MNNETAQQIINSLIFNAEATSKTAIAKRLQRLTQLQSITAMNNETAQQIINVLIFNAEATSKTAIAKRLQKLTQLQNITAMQTAK